MSPPSPSPSSTLASPKNPPRRPNHHGGRKGPRRRQISGDHLQLQQRFRRQENSRRLGTHSIRQTEAPRRRKSSDLPFARARGRQRTARSRRSLHPANRLWHHARKSGRRLRESERQAKDHFHRSSAQAEVSGLFALRR